MINHEELHLYMILIFDLNFQMNIFITNFIKLKDIEKSLML